MSVPTNLIPTLITGLQEYTGSSTLGYMPYILDGRTYKVQFANIAAVGAVPSSRVIAAGTGLAGGGDLSANRVISIANGGVGFDQLALSGVTQGTYGSGSAIPILTVDSKGRITSATTAPLDVTGFVPTSRTITAGDGLTGGGALTSNVTLAANFSAATPSALGTASAGTAITVSRGDHVHPAVNLSDTSQTQGALPLGRGGTGDALSPVAGAVVYSTGSKFALTNPGIVGQVLVSAGTDEPQWQTILGTGTVTSVSVSTANGFAGFVANPATVPDITLSTTVTGMLKGDGTGMSAATAGVDYVEPGPYTTSGLTMASARLLGRTTASVGAAQEITVGTGLTLSGGSLVNAAPDQVVALTGGTAISVTGTYPSFTITNTAPDQTVSLTAGTAISISGTYPSFSVTNTAPDQVVSLTGAGTTTVTGTYPNFTITSNDSTSGTVTSVNASGGTTGMSFTGGPITSAGTLTLNGTLAVANGGTGATDAATALTNLGAYPASNPAGYTTNVGTVTSVSGTGTVSGLSLSGTVTSAGSLTLGGTLAVLPSNFASQTANTVLAAPNGSAGVPTFRAIVAADVPTLNQNTTGTASNVTGVVAVANGGTGASVAGTARTNLGAAASGANTDITSIALTTGTISTSPVNGTDIVNKAYADSIASGINFHQSVRLATAAALPANTYNNGTSGVGATLTANANGALTVDGVAAVVGNRILVKNEATQANNGVYTVTQVGNGSTPYILTRATDFDSSGSGVDQIDAGDFFLVTAGSTLANTSWVQQTPLPITVGTTAIVFSQFAAPVLYSAGTGLSLTGTTFSITDTGVSASTYGSASSVPVIAVNAQGQITSASSSSIAIAASQITSGALAIANGGTGATSAATALTNLGAYPASNPSGFTSNTGTVTSVNLTAGTGVSVSGGPITASGSITVTNTAPDQVVSLTGSGATTVTGTYPNFTISSTAGTGTVTSVNVSGGTTGLTTSGGPVTSSGTITLAGTLNVANGGTGATTLSSGYVLKGNGTSAVSASVIYDNGTNVGIGTTSPSYKLHVSSSSAPILAENSGGGAYMVDLKATTGTYNVRLGNAGDIFLLNVNNAERMRIASDGTTTFNVGGVSNTHQFNYNESGGEIQLIDSTGAGPILLDNVSGLARLYKVGTGAMSIGTTGANYLEFITNSSQRLSISSGGFVTANVDMRAPIFYDSDNTAYYLNAAGNSVFSAFNIGGGEVYFYGSATNAVSIRTGAGGAYKYFAFDASGNFYALNGSVYGQRFYDQDNTAYYVDPASTSVLRGLTLTDTVPTITFSSTTSGRSSAFGMTDAYNMYLNAPSGGILYLSNFQAPIMYDRDNSGYYVDPASTSALNIVTTAGYIQTYSGGVKWDESGTRSWSMYPSGGAMLLNSGDGNGSFNLGASGGVRAPIFYDSDNTAYYINGAGNSVLNTLYMRNGSIEAKFAQASQFGYSSSYRTVVLGNEYLTTISMGVDVSGNASGSFNGQGEGREVLFRNGVSFITPNSANNSYLNVMQMTDGVANFTAYATAAGSFRAPIFYDSNNTGYYLDPNSTSNLVGLTVLNRISGSVFGCTFTQDSQDQDNITLRTDSGFYQSSSGTTAEGWPINDGNWQHMISCTHTNDGNYFAMQLGASFFSQGLFYRSVANSGTQAWSRVALYDNGYAAPLYASIYYDANDTSYYVNPNGNSVLFSFDNINQRCSYSRQWDNYPGISVYNTTDQGPQGDFRIFGSAGANGGDFSVRLLVDGNVQSLADLVGSAVRAQIFYDTNDTSAYVDPAGASWIKGGFQMTVPSPSNDCFGGLEMREAGLVANTQTAATYAPGINFHWGSIAAARIYMASNGAFVLGGQGDITNNRRSLFCADLYATGNVTAYYSDERLKTRIGKIDNALDIVSKLSGFRYVNNDLAKSFGYEGDEVQLGVSAQEVEAVLPEVVRQAAFDMDVDSPDGRSKSGENYKTVQYDRLVPLLIEAIKELTDKVKALEAKEQ